MRSKKNTNINRNKKSNGVMFEYLVDGEILAIVDLDGEKSVTHTISEVLMSIQSEGIDLQSYKIIYRDSDAIWDGIEITNFSTMSVKFFSIGEKNIYDAFNKIRSKCF